MRLVGCAAFGLAVAACSSAPRPAEPSPVPEPVVMAGPASPVPAPAPLLSVRAVAGRYRLSSALDRRGRATTTTTTMRLYSSAATARAPDAPDDQFRATLSLPGYTRSANRRGTLQSAAWWPVPGDSIVIQFTGQADATVQLRGVVSGRALGGEVWLTTASGTTFQLGTFTARRY